MVLCEFYNWLCIFSETFSTHLVFQRTSSLSIMMGCDKSDLHHKKFSYTTSSKQTVAKLMKRSQNKILGKFFNAESVALLPRAHHPYQFWWLWRNKSWQFLAGIIQALAFPGKLFCLVCSLHCYNLPLNYHPQTFFVLSVL